MIQTQVVSGSLQIFTLLVSATANRPRSTARPPGTRQVGKVEANIETYWLRFDTRETTAVPVNVREDTGRGGRGEVYLACCARVSLGQLSLLSFLALYIVIISCASFPFFSRQDIVRIPLMTLAPRLHGHSETNRAVGRGAADMRRAAIHVTRHARPIPYQLDAREPMRMTESIISSDRHSALG